MIRLLGSRKMLCDGLTRRDFLQLGGLGALGLGLDTSFRLQEAHAAAERTSRSFGKAKACILLFPYGSPPQHETFDPKPDAPREIQGEMKAIPSSVPGLRVCDHLPRIARVMDRVTVVRSMTHPFPVHGVAYVVSGIPTYTPDLEIRPRDARHWPFIGSIVDYLEEKRSRSVPAMPRNVGLPWLLNSKTDLDVSAGPYAGFLGQAHDPVWTDFDGKGTKIAPPYSPGQKKTFLDPFGGTTPDGRFRFSSLGHLSGDLTVERVNLRRSLLEQFDRARRQTDARARTFDRFQQRAFALVTSNRMHQALDIGREPLRLREAYGMTLFGQACLAA